MKDNRILVMDVLRGSLNDGPGIRTTVFTKGCPLRCLWCHNPESQGFQPELSYEDSKCIHCGSCQTACPNSVHDVTSEGHELKRSDCLACGACVAECPQNGLKIVGQWWEPSALVELCLRDLHFYRRSGGGITISGGEPMSQFSGVFETLRLAKQAGLHTCLDTCGQAALSRYQEILPFVDLFLWDFKATGQEDHTRLTGVNGVRIEENLRSLYDAGAAIRLRCPLIPGLNDSSEHLAKIAQLSHEMPRLHGIDLMPFHSLARDKAAKVGMVQEGLPTESASQEDISHWLTKLADLGCTRATIG